MADSPSSEKDKTTEPPAPEILRTQSDSASASSGEGVNPTVAPKVPLRARHAAYRPSHKATFIGLGVVAAILAVNAGVIAFVLRGQSEDTAKARQDEVIISSATLDKLGVTRTAVNNLGTELVVGPNSRFNGKVTIGSDVSVAGQLRLNSRFSANEASLTRLEAGNTQLAQLNVNGDGTLSNLNLRRDLVVAGQTRFQGPVTATQLFTVSNNLNVSGNLAVGGTLSARSFQANNLISDNNLVIGGHIISRGASPRVAPGNALGSNGTVSISGSDAVGTVAANVGVGANSGSVAHVTFRTPYNSTPRVIVTGGGFGVGSWYVTRSQTGFSIGVNNAMPAGPYHFDYIIMQ